MDGSGSGIHRVIDHRKVTLGGTVGVVARIHAHRHLMPAAETPDGGKMLLRHIEIHEGRRQLMDHHQRNVISLHQVSGVYQQVAGAAGDGRVDLAVTQVEFRGVHRGLVAFQRGPGAVDGGPAGAGRFAGHVG